MGGHAAAGSRTFAPAERSRGLRRVRGDGPALFDSSASDDPRGRYGYLTADVRAGSVGEVRRAVRDFPAAPLDGLPPFRGGAVGLWVYEEGRRFERLPEPKTWRVPGIGGSSALVAPSRSVTAVADWVLAWDHAAVRAWVVCHAVPRADGTPRDPDARLRWVLDRLRSGPTARREPAGESFVPDLPPVPGFPGAYSPFTREGYEAAVARAVEYVRAGDVFQVNLAQPLLVPRPAGEDWRPLYDRLRAENPAPFAGVFAAGGGPPVLSASPERFLSLTPDAVGRLHAEARPIKGTRPRSGDPATDAAAAADLLASGKDRAENVMIVDLLRNDLSKVCEPGNVRVPGLCELESYAGVHHLVSEVRGTLREGRDAWDLLEAAFPGGSITGAPKVRAMEIIHELEPAARGPYCGSMFWIGFDGAMDSSILIRTVLPHPAGFALAWVGGGVTARSDPAAEYDETLHKAAATLRALGVAG